ncbi:MAG: transcription-repair coupling factor, partial [Paracoccaceae bacterium]
MTAEPTTKRWIIGGAPEGFDARLVSSLLHDRNAPVLHIARDDTRLEEMRQALAFFAPDLPVLAFPAWDCLPYDRVSPDPTISATRMATLAALAKGIGGPFVLLTTVAAAMQRVPARAVVSNSSFAAHVGKQIDVDLLRSFLGRMGFNQAPTVTEPGDYAIRGGLIDLFAPGHGGPVRLDLFGDVLESARRFDAETQRTVEKLTRVEFAPVSEVILDEAAILRFRRNYRHAFGAARADDPLYEAVSAGRKHQGMEHWAPFFHDGMETLFDYVPGAAVTLDDQATAARAARWETITDHFDNRMSALENRTRLDSVYKPCPPDALYLNDAAFDQAADGFESRQFSALRQAPGPGVLDAGGRIGRNFAPERQVENVNVFSALADHINARKAVSQVVIACYSKGAGERMGHLIAEESGINARPISHAREITGNTGGVFLAVWPIEHGFEAPNLTVITEQDVLGDRLIRVSRRKRRAENFLTEANALSLGDLVVHVNHGIGRFRGLETITAAGAPHDCIALEYAGGDRLFLPVENIELLSRFGHEEGLLDRLGSSAWQARKARLKERIRKIADRLIRIAAERVLRKAPVLEAPEGDMERFGAAFPYSETDDQLDAIEDVLADLASGRPMDRLICGDVGFGKTEVAMRAAFAAASAGKQVAVVAPTTLLARQHFKTFSERFRGLPVTVSTLSRFVGTKEAAVTRQGLQNGSVDIVIGTHAVLAKSVRFLDLGLLVVDEEQKFGVQHKERLKQIRSEVHVLTLTATPIPRTLQLSLSGVRDMSIIGTPPVDRLAIRTYVSEFDTVTIREALLREHYRGGQSFYVVPRISDIREISEFLSDHVPEIRFVTAHGQMAAGDLDRRMNAFYDGTHDVLLATTIVESGLDIPTANTMIIHRADMFGLAQLYQIRGRVGRSKTRAYAFLTTKPRARLTPGAE